MRQGNVDFKGREAFHPCDVGYTRPNRWDMNTVYIRGNSFEYGFIVHKSSIYGM